MDRGARRRGIVYAGSGDDLAALIAGSDRPASKDILGFLLLDGRGGAPSATLPVFERAEAFAAALARGDLGDIEALALVGSLSPRERVREALWAAAAAHISVLKVVQRDGAARLAPLSIDDLLDSSAPEFDRAPIAAMIQGKRVLITGGGGSIGAELARRVAALGPASLTIMENSECNLFEIDHEIGVAHPGVPRVTALCDIRDQKAVQRWFDRTAPEIVLHAAALKQVPLLESHPCEAALTNIWGSKVIAQAAEAVGAHLIYVSTDKAVHPSSVMGATKRLGELYCQALDRASARPEKPRRIVIRLGNVIGSAGSVTPMFERQIAAGGPLTVTHLEIERYFITVRRAADFILQAGAYGLARPDLRGATYLLEMGEPIKVADLAHDMILLAGKRPGLDIALKTIGLRPGEKLYEDLLAQDEWLETETPCGLRVILSPSLDLGAVSARVGEVVARARAGVDDGVRALVRAPLPLPMSGVAEAVGG